MRYADAAMKSTWHASRAAGCLLLLAQLAACGDWEEEVALPGSTGEPCNPEAAGTDGCDMTSVCVVQKGVCHADCAQEPCTGTCSDYFSPIVERSLSVCFAVGEPVPGARTPASPSPR